MSPDEAAQERMLEGFRRAYQWLRLRELGDDAGIEELCSRFEEPADYVWIHAAMDARIRDLLGTLGDAARPDLRAANATLVETVEDPTADTLNRRLLAEFALLIAEGLIEQRYPTPADRLRFYEVSARMGYEIAEPGHPGRTGVFDE